MDAISRVIREGNVDIFRGLVREAKDLKEDHLRMAIKLGRLDMICHMFVVGHVATEKDFFEALNTGDREMIKTVAEERAFLIEEAHVKIADKLADRKISKYVEKLRKRDSGNEFRSVMSIQTAIINGYESVVMSKLREGYEPTYEDFKLCISRGNLRIAKIIWETGEFMIDKEVLRIAEKRGNDDMIRFVKEIFHDFKLDKKKISNPLEFQDALRSKHYQTIAHIFYSGYKPTYDDFKVSVSINDLDIIQLIYESKSFQIDEDILTIATVRGDEQIIDYIATIFTQESQGDDDLYHYAPGPSPKRIQISPQPKKEQKKEIDPIEAASYFGILESVERHVNEGKVFTSRHADIAAKNNHLELLQYFGLHGVSPTQEGIDRAIIWGFKDIIEYSLIMEAEPSAQAVDDTAIYGNSDILEYLWSVGFRPSNDVMNKAIERGTFNTLPFLWSKGYRTDQHYLEEAKRKNQKQITTFLLSKGMAFDETQKEYPPVVVTPPEQEPKLEPIKPHVWFPSFNEQVEREKLLAWPSGSTSKMHHRTPSIDFSTEKKDDEFGNYFAI